MGHTCCEPGAWDCHQQHQNPRQEGQLHGVSRECNQQAAQWLRDCLTGSLPAGLAPPTSPAQRSAAPLLPFSLPFLPPSSQSPQVPRDQQSLICLVSTFLSHHHSLGTLCENEGLECPEMKTFGT